MEDYWICTVQFGSSDSLGGLFYYFDGNLEHKSSVYKNFMLSFPISKWIVHCKQIAMILAFNGSFDISFLVIHSNTTFHMIYEQRSQLLIWLDLLCPSIHPLASAMRHEQEPVWFPLQFSRFIEHHNENPFYHVYLVTVDECGFYTTYSWLNSSAVCDAPGGAVTLMWPVHFILCSIVRMTIVLCAVPVVEL